MASVDVSAGRRRRRTGTWVPRQRGFGRRGRAALAAVPVRVQPVRMSPATRTLRWTLAVFSILTAWLLAYALGFSAIQEHRSQQTLYAQFREQLALATAPTGGSIPLGHPVASLTAPSAGIHNAVVVEGSSSAQTRLGPGHVPNTVLPGQAGASVVLGRAATFGAPFRRLTSLAVGDLFTATTAQGRFDYRVIDVRRAGSPLPPPLGAGGSQLTLVTSEGAGWLRGWAPTQTVYVDAVLSHGEAVTAPAGRPSAVPVDMQPMKGDSSALVAVVFWLEGLLLVALGVAWTWRRWGPPQAWLVGGVLVVATVWGASSAALAMLPNII